MKLSDDTKQKATEYIAKIKAQIETDLQITISTNKPLMPLKQRIMHEFHIREKQELIARLEIKANDLGYTLVKVM
jgi:hypothetical protein